MVMKMAADDLMLALAKLSPKDLKEVQARTAALLSSQSDPKADEAETLVYQQMVNVLKDLGHADLPPLKVIRLSKGGKALKEGTPKFVRYVEKHFRPQRRIDKINCLQLLLKMLVRRLHRDGVPVSVTTLAQGLLRIAEVVDDEFPGYLESGFLPLLLKKFNMVSDDKRNTLSAS